MTDKPMTIDGREFRVGRSYRQRRGRHREALVFLGASKAPGLRDHVAYRPASMERETYNVTRAKWAALAGAEVAA